MKGRSKRGRKGKRKRGDDAGSVPGHGESVGAEGLDRMPCWLLSADILSLAHQTAFDTNETWLLCP